MSHAVKTERSKKRTLDVFFSGSCSAPPPVKEFFRTGFSPNNNKLSGRGHFIMENNRTIETSNTQYGIQTVNGALVSQASKVLDQKLAPLFRKFSESRTIEQILILW